MQKQEKYKECIIGKIPIIISEIGESQCMWQRQLVVYFILLTVAVRRVARCDRQVGRGGCHGQAGIGWRGLIGMASMVRGMGGHKG